MDILIQDLSLYLVNKLTTTPSTQRLLVGIAGIPASGKSTFSQILTQSVNKLLDDHASRAWQEEESSAEGTQNIREATVELATLARSTKPSSILEQRDESSTDIRNNDANSTTMKEQAILVGLDGWHLSRAQLDLLPDPETAHARRGAHWTFDGSNYVSFIRQLRSGSPDTATIPPDLSNVDVPTNIIMAPSFDHALKDPTYNAVSVYPHHRIVIIEGLYTFLNLDPWREAAFMLDERWFIEVDKPEARRRLIQRHLITGITKTDEEAAQRADLNDLPNGEFIIANILEPTRIIQSKTIPIL